MDVCLSSKQPGCPAEALSSPDVLLEPEEGALQKDGTGGPPGGNLLLPTPAPSWLLAWDGIFPVNFSDKYFHFLLVLGFPIMKLIENTFI